MQEGQPRGSTPRRARRGRLSRSADFERAYRQGRSHANRHFVVYAFPREGGKQARLGLSVSRKVGGATNHNRMKRLVREAFAAEAGVIPAGHDVVIVARPTARELAERDGLQGVREALRELFERAARA
jgi:ribonuclease P protein component